MPPVAPQPLPWRAIVPAALLGTAACIAVALLPLLLGGNGIAHVLRSGTDGPSAAVVKADLGPDALGLGGGHDGQQTYVVARDLFHPGDGAPHLDRPAYRYQRIALPALARAVHPAGGGGIGLVWALVAVGVASILLGGLATGALSVQVGASPRLAAAYGLLPGSIFALGYTLVDALALSAVVAAIGLSLRGRTGWAIAAGLLAVLAKEPIGLVLLGVALWRRDRRGLALVVIPGVAAATWWLLLRVVLAGWPDSADEFREPIRGLATAMRYWSEGGDPAAAGLMGLTLVAGVAALATGRLAHHPLGWALVLQMAFLPLLNANVLGATANLSRTVAPTLLLAIIVLRGAPDAAGGAGRDEDLDRSDVESSLVPVDVR